MCRRRRMRALPRAKMQRRLMPLSLIFRFTWQFDNTRIDVILGVNGQCRARDISTSREAMTMASRS